MAGFKNFKPPMKWSWIMGSEAHRAALDGGLILVVQPCRQGLMSLELCDQNAERLFYELFSCNSMKDAKEYALRAADAFLGRFEQKKKNNVKVRHQT